MPDSPIVDKENRTEINSLGEGTSEWAEGGGVDLPLLRWNNFDDARLHPVMVDLINEVFERAELIHCLLATSVYRTFSPKFTRGLFSFFLFPPLPSL